MATTEIQLGHARSTSAMRRPRVFYGWWIVGACVVLLTLTAGIGVYGLGVFLPALEDAFGVGPALASLGMTTFFLVQGLAGPATGRLVDRAGARRGMVGGSAVFGLGLLGLALAQGLWQAVLAYGVLALGFAGAGLVPVGALVARWFQARRGLAMSLAMCGVSLGGVLMVPLASRLIGALGWRAAALALAALVWAAAIPLAALVIRARPADLTLLPDGAPPGRDAPAGAPAPVTAAAGWTLAAARRTRAFWLLTGGYLLVNLAQTGVLAHQIRFLTHGGADAGALAPTAAALAVSLTALASIGGRLALGAVVDRLDRRLVVAGLVGLQAAATVSLLAARGNPGLLYAAGGAFGLGMGCVLLLHGLLVGDLFGTASFGAIYGLSLPLTTLETAGGPWAAGLLFDRFGRYDEAFGSFAAISLLAAVILLRAGHGAAARPLTTP